MPNKKETPSGMSANVDRLIHEPSRYNIMALLYVVDKAEYLFVLNHTGMTAGNLTAHLAKLEKAGYLSVHKKFVRRKPKTLLSLTPQGRKAFDAYRREMKDLFAAPPASQPDKSGGGDGG
jgi:DNA-binding MarR family transcriptional regulator